MLSAVVKLGCASVMTVASFEIQMCQTCAMVNNVDTLVNRWSKYATSCSALRALNACQHNIVSANSHKAQDPNSL